MKPRITARTLTYAEAIPCSFCGESIDVAIVVGQDGSKRKLRMCADCAIEARLALNRLIIRRPVATK